MLFSPPIKLILSLQFKVSLPKKTKLFGDLSYEEQQTRRVMLEKYLFEILAAPEVTSSSEAVTVSKFLSPAETDIFLKSKEKRPISGHLTPINDKKVGEGFFFPKKLFCLSSNLFQDRGSALFKRDSMPRDITGGNFRSATPTGSNSPANSRRPLSLAQRPDPEERMFIILSFSI